MFMKCPRCPKKYTDGPNQEAIDLFGECLACIHIEYEAKQAEESYDEMQLEVED